MGSKLRLTEHVGKTKFHSGSYTHNGSDHARSRPQREAQPKNIFLVIIDIIIK